MPIPDGDSPLMRALRGEDEGFADLYKQHNPVLARYVRARMPWATEDVLSEIWLDVARSLPRFKGVDEEGFAKLLFTIASRRMVDFRRRRIPEPTAIVPDGADQGPGPSEVAEADEGYRRALEAVGQLPDDQQEIILLRVVAGVDVATVAEITGRRPGAVRVIQHRALVKLREMLYDSEKISENL